MMGARVSRTRTAKKIMAQMQRSIGRRVQAGLVAIGHVLLDASQPLVPRDTEYLASTGRVTRIGSLLRTVVVVGYGGKDFPPEIVWSDKEERMVTRHPCVYTVYVHEDVTKHHDPGQANFLREPLLTQHEAMRLAFNVEMNRR